MKQVEKTTKHVEREDASKKKQAPLFVYEQPENSQDTSQVRIAFLILLGVCAALYIAGVMLKMQLLILIALTIVIIGAVVLFMIYRRIRKATAPIDEEEIDRQVEQYKIDLIDTFNGYDVAYSVDDILTATDEYRARLVQEHASLADIDPQNMMSVLKNMFASSRKESKKRKNIMKKDEKQRKRQRKTKQESQVGKKQTKRSRGKENQTCKKG